MSPTTISLDQWIQDFRREVAALDIHPVGCRAKEMHEAVARGDIEEFNRLVRIMQDKVTDEPHWEEDKRDPAKDLDYQPRHFHEARA
jgi:hypothetical protein